VPPVEAIFFVAIIHWFGDVWKVALFRQGFNLRLLVLFGAVGLITSYFGAFISLGANGQVLLRALGAFLAGYAIFLLLETKFKVQANNLTALTGNRAASGLNSYHYLLYARCSFARTVMVGNAGFHSSLVSWSKACQTSSGQNSANQISSGGSSVFVYYWDKANPFSIRPGLHLEA